MILEDPDIVDERPLLRLPGNLAITFALAEAALLGTGIGPASEFVPGIDFGHHLVALLALRVPGREYLSAIEFTAFKSATRRSGSGLYPP